MTNTPLTPPIPPSLLASLNGTHFTPTQIRLLEILKDGELHSRLQLKECLNDELTKMATLGVHLVFLRKKLRGHGMDVVCQLRGKSILYQLIAA